MAHHDETSDEELVGLARSAAPDDLRAFEALVQRHRDGVTANCRFLSRSSADAEDLSQEVFVKAYFSLQGFEGRSRFRTWLQRIKINHCLNFLEKREGKSFVPLEDPSMEGAPELRVSARAEASMQAQDDRGRIAEVLDSMSDTLRIPLILRDMDQLSYEEIATELGLGLSAVKMRIKRAREEFRQRFEGKPLGSGARGSRPAPPEASA